SDASAATATTENALTVRDVDTRPLVAMRPEPAYTEEARQNQTEGVVLLRAVFAANGTVTNVRVASGLPHGLEDKAIEAAKKIVFIPAVKDGKFVSTWMQLEYHFNLH
ncbi:MAG TPA: energy transducer TonB, partial [Pyrinomonadaceae bacterium]|nr:energy transducer TonB [Pyrinomonadaceae bacterium]